jgi:bla regulator protein BlaR1
MIAHLTTMFRVVLEASWQSSLIILIILLVRPLMGLRVPARWRYWLWAPVVLRLLIPVTVLPPSPVSMQNIAVVDHPLEKAGLMPPVTRQMEPWTGPVPQGPIMAHPETEAPAVAPIETPEPESRGAIWWEAAAILWLAGLLTALGATIAAQIMIRRRLSMDTGRVDPAAEADWEGCCARLRVRQRPALRVSGDVASPALVGLLRPMLLLPRKGPEFSAEDWENIFAHELAHYRRGDHWIHALHLLALAAHWFNPLVWLGLRQLRADRELAADEWALGHLEADRSTGYGDTLLKVLAGMSRSRLSLASVGILEDGIPLKQRLRRIAGFGPRTVIGSALGAGLVAAVALVALGRQADKPDLSLYNGMPPQEILMHAALEGNVPVLREMLDEGVDVNSVTNDDRKQTALNVAVFNGKVDAMKFLISKGADVNKTDVKLGTALQSAMEGGQPECADYLMAHGATADPAMIAAYKDDTAGLKPVLEKNPPDVELLKHLCRIAAVNGHATEFQTVIGRLRIQPGATDWDISDGAMNIAIERGYRDVVQAALDESPYANKLNKSGVMRLAAAVDQNPGMRAWLESKGYKIPQYTDGERLIDATEQEDLPEMERLLKKGADVNYRGESSWTPITKAAAWNKVYATKLLLAHGADPNSVHLPGWDYSGICLTSKPEIADMLLKAGGNINATLYKRNVHIMDYAVTFGATDMVKWYIAHGVDPTKVQSDTPDETFLFSADNAEIAEILIQHGVDPKAKTKDGSTALHQVCEMSRHPAEVAKVLLEHGADPNATDKYGRTPITEAKDAATIDVLTKFGAKVAATDKEGNSIIDNFNNGADATRLKALIAHGAKFDPKTDGPTILVRAAWSDQTDIIQYMLDLGVDPNIKGCWNKEANDYMLPLTAAVTDGQYDAAKLLVDHGAKISGPEKEKGAKAFENSMINALDNRRKDIVKLFWDHGDRSISELCYELSQGAALNELQKLLDKGVPADPPQDTEMSPLVVAADLGRLDAVKLLLQHGASIDGVGTATPHNYRPLDSAAFEGQDEIVDYLLHHGVKPDHQTLWDAVWNCNPYPNQRSKDHFEKTIKLLLAAGVMKPMSAQDKAGFLEAALFSRYPGGNINVIHMLLDAGASLDTPVDNGKSVMQLAQDACKDTTCSTPTKEMMAALTLADKKTGQ